ncbi:MAG: hypothetical protein JNK91_12835 [Ferruginibacter sp.]|nr:hypothetical protein [Ferruginibacter sp.]HNF02606.1 hypothetical protein [Ferruginibacter sp.]HNJ28911.1 hypothetical protein [Ferruginibacter sp.]
MRTILAFIFSSFIFSSCTDNSDKHIAAYKIADEGFQQSNTWINYNNNQLYRLLEDRLRDNKTKLQASIWQPKADRIRYLSTGMVEFIQSLKQELRSEANGGISAKNEDWMKKESISRKVFESKGRGGELYQRLINYGDSIMNVDDKVKVKFALGLGLFSQGFDIKTHSASDFTKKYFENMPAMGAILLLSKFENNVRCIENQTVEFCLNQIGYLDGVTEGYCFLLGQTSTCLRAGEILEIDAGMGAYTTLPNLKLRFNGKSVLLNENGIAIYKVKVPAKPGRYRIRVKGEFTAEDGKPVPISKTVYYSVVE